MNATTKPETTQTLERQKTRERILAVAAWLTQGLLRPQAVAGAMREWNVSRRSAQVYVQKAANRIAKMAEYDDPLFAMKLSQLQRDRLFQQLQNLQMDSVQMEPHEVRSILQTIQAQLKVLDSRDRTAAKIAQFEAKYGRVEARRRQQPVEPASTPPAEQPQEPVLTRKPARPEGMRSAAQITRPRGQDVRLNTNPPKELHPEEAAVTQPALRPENCALEMAGVVYSTVT